MAKINLIQRVFGSLAQVTSRGTESVVKFGRATDEPTRLLASRWLASRHPRVDRLPRAADPTDSVGLPCVTAYSPKQATPCMNAGALRTGRSAA
jgi:hypothetical protein